MNYDYSILTGYFPESVIEEFYASAIDPRLCLLNAEFLNGDKAISELLGEVKIHNNNGTLKKGYRDTYASIVEHGGTSYTGIDIERDCIASCSSFKPLQPRLDKEGKPIKYEHPAKKPCKAFLPIIDLETWQAISVRVGVALPPDLVTRQWQLVDIGSDEWRDECQRLSLEFLQWILDDSTIPVTTTEGAKKALSGISTGEICISLTGVWNGCPELNKGEKDYTLINDLKLISTPNRRINIAFDKDSKPKTINMVRAATKRFAGLLIAADCQVYLADWSSDRGKGIDDLIFNDGVEAFRRVIDSAKPIEAAAIEGTEDGKKPHKSVAERLLEIGRTATYFQTPDRIAYADITIAGDRHTYAVRSRAFRMWLAGMYFNVEGKGIGSQTMQDTLSTLEAIALYGQDSPTREVHLRIAQHQEKIYLDLGTPDWKAIEVDSLGWRVINEPPIRFWRPDSLQALPYPAANGTLDELKDLLDVDDRTWTLIVTFVLFCFFPKYHKPILILHGEQGSGKTTIAEFLKSLIDPGKAGLLPAISDLHRLAIAASRRWVLAYDNLSGINAEQSDALCRISTGGGFSTRTLHTTDQETVFEFTRPQIITGIDSLATRGDLLQRSLMVSLPSISPERRKTRAALETQLNEARPRILGALLTALSQTLRALPATNPTELPRMADFAKFAIASTQALGLTQAAFWDAFNSNQDEAHEIVTESSPIAQAILRLMETRTVWQGTAAELLADIEPLTTEKTLRSRQWAGNPSSLGKALTRLAPDLRGLGIDVDSLRTGKAGTRKIVLEKLAKKTSEMSAMSESLPSNGSMADIKADMKSEADVSCQPHVSPNVSHETLMQQEIQLSADMTDMADIKKATNSSNTNKKYVDRFNVGDCVKAADPYHQRGCDLGVVKEIEGDVYSVEWESDRKCYRYTFDELEAIGGSALLD
jgi:Domain of unknown function (DUF3854)